MPVEQRLEALGLALPDELQLPPGVEIPFQLVRVRSDRPFVSRHGALASDGKPLGPFRKVPSEVSLEDGQKSTRLAMLAILSSLKAALGDLERVTAWAMVNGFVNADPGYSKTTLVMNPVSELLLELYGHEAGAHARTAIGVAGVPLNLPVIISAEVEVAT
ncbi:MAG: RidA family protein [Actinobacteria bacterium]|nr:RidA family protein [Actinomycetota bacterium]